MAKRLLPFLSLILLVAAFSSCKKEKQPYYGTDFTRGYYPLDRGHFITYDVDSTIWGPSGTKRMTHYQMRYIIADTFTDLQNRPSYRVDAIIRNNDSSSQWRSSDVFYVTPTAGSIDVVQNNLRFTKLVFPVVNGTTWKGNNAITVADQDLSFFADWDYVYSGRGASYNNGRVSYDNTVTVQERDETIGDPDLNPADYATRNFSKAIYGYGVGLIYREFVHWTYDPIPGSTVNGRVGYEVVMRAVENN